MKLHVSNISFLEIVSGITIGLITVVFLTREKIEFENLALGSGTSSYFATNEGHPIHIGHLQHPEVENLVEGWQLRGERNVLFVLGNSQTHGINQKKDGEMSYNHLLFADYEKHGIDVITHSFPNASLQEFLLAFIYWKSRLPIKRLVVPLFMDDLREDGIREYYFALFRELKFRIEPVATIAQSINEDIMKFHTNKVSKEDEIDPDLKGLDLTAQQRSEEWLNDYLNDNFKSWDNRPTMRGKIFNYLYKLRNTLFGINAQSKRKMIASRVDKNMSALREVLQVSQKANIAVLLYIPPLRNDVEPPYDLDEYKRIKKQFEDLSAQYSCATLINLENAVPGEYWGTKDPTNFFNEYEYDFMHFQYEGHRLLYEQLASTLNKMPKI